jgi:predicted transcriptional regulator of viral defense system
MNDRHSAGPDREGLFQLASDQHGYFTATQARANGYSRALLAHHARSGTFRRVRAGLYRFRDYPSEPREEVAAAWLAVGADRAVVSHQSALDLWGLSDLIPDAIHLTVPRSRRYVSRLPGVAIHTTSRAFEPGDIRTWEGMRVTAPGRTILDIAEVGAAPEQVEAAVRQAAERGWIDPEDLRRRAALRGGRVAGLIDRALIDYSAHQGGL